MKFDVDRDNECRSLQWRFSGRQPGERWDCVSSLAGGRGPTLESTKRLFPVRHFVFSRPARGRVHETSGQAFQAVSAFRPMRSEIPRRFQLKPPLREQLDAAETALRSYVAGAARELRRIRPFERGFPSVRRRGAQRSLPRPAFRPRSNREFRTACLQADPPWSAKESEKKREPQGAQRSQRSLFSGEFGLCSENARLARDVHETAFGIGMRTRSAATLSRNTHGASVQRTGVYEPVSAAHCAKRSGPIADASTVSIWAAP